MKRYIILTLAAASAVLGLRSEERPDTLFTAQTPETAIITENSHGLTVTVINSDQTSSVFEQPYDSNSAIKSNQETRSGYMTTIYDGVIGIKAKRHWNVITGGIALGLVNAVDQPDDLGLQWNKSFEISWVNAIAAEYCNRGFSVSLGLGFDWRNYRITTRSHHLTINGAGGIGTSPYPEGSTPRNSRIKVFSLGLPLLFSQKFGNSGIAITAGAILNFNTHASVRTSYRTETGNDMEEYAEGFHHRRTTIDFLGCLQLWKSCGLYVRYSPQTILQGHGSPQFKPLSAGVMFFL